MKKAGSLDRLVEIRDCRRAKPARFRASVAADMGIAMWLPESRGQIDPRNGERIVYSKARARRPHDTSKGMGGPSARRTPARYDPDCPICRFDTTSILDTARLPSGAKTFINKNLFPIAYPFHGSDQGRLASLEWGNRVHPTRGFRADGCHYVQWTSTRHDRDIHNSPVRDLAVVLERLGAFEEALLAKGASPMSRVDGDGERFGHVGIIKNFGRAVGGSLVHGHQQILHTNIVPRRTEEDRRFRDTLGFSFTEFLATRNPSRFTIREYGGRFRLVTPYFLKRPLESILFVTDPAKDYVHDLDRKDREALARGLRDATRAVIELMPRRGNEIAYNLVFHTGPIGGMYVEILPLTQKIGGYEQLGIYVCEGTPETSHALYREFLGEVRD